LFRRLQSADGGVPRGIETNGDPPHAEVSWYQSMPAYVYAPDMQSSYQYVATAARLVRVLDGLHKLELADQYRDSTIKAMRWAEQQFASWQAAEKPIPRGIHMDRATAALELYALTGDRAWHQVFADEGALSEENCGWFGIAEHDHRDLAFTYARLPDERADASIKRLARQITLDRAEAALRYAEGNACNLTSDDPHRIMFIGFYSVPQAIELVRAHYLSGERRYLSGIVQATLFASGGNPNNMTYTTGVGADPPLHTLKLDSRYSGQPTPAGMTPYGNMDFIAWKEQWAIWPLKDHLSKVCEPSEWDWPINEAYFDVFLFPAICEPTINQTLGPNAYVWGYLAARK
jgi:endoglucanase